MSQFTRTNGSRSATDRLAENLQASMAAKQALLLDEAELKHFEAAARLIVKTFCHGARLYIAGNGGSASDAQHLAGEFVCKLTTPRAPLPAEALAADCATLTAIANDFSYEEIFARQLACKATVHDAFLALTTSGNSPNIVRALQLCRTKGVPTILFAGRGGGAANSYADVAVLVPGQNSCRIQETHLVLYHTLVECVEAALFDGGDFGPRQPMAIAAAT
jgi:D-sedoheptulose 7-phosphate isomerase